LAPELISRITSNKMFHQMARFWDFLTIAAVEQGY
jgi:hypothetical protein